MMMEADPQHIEDLRAILGRRLQVLELQLARVGEGRAEPSLLTEIEEVQAELAQLGDQTESTMAVSTRTAPPAGGVTREEFNSLAARFDRFVERFDRFVVMQMITVAASVLSLVSFIMTMVMFASR